MTKNSNINAKLSRNYVDNYISYTNRIMYDQGSEFFVHEFRKSLIKIKYWITAKPCTLGNPTSNVILEQIHQVLGNLVRTYNIKETYAEEDNSWSGILDTLAFVIHLT